MYNERFTEALMRFICMLFAILFLLVLGCGLLCSCKSTQQVRTEYLVRESVKTDSVMCHDSVFIIIRGDTVYKYKERIVNRFMFLNKRDTVIMTDTIFQTVEVERNLSRWESVKQDVGGMAMGGFFILLLLLLAKIVKK